MKKDISTTTTTCIFLLLLLLLHRPLTVVNRQIAFEQTSANQNPDSRFILEVGYFGITIPGRVIRQSLLLSKAGWYFHDKRTKQVDWNINKYFPSFKLYTTTKKKANTNNFFAKSFMLWKVKGWKEWVTFFIENFDNQISRFKVKQK